MRRFAGYLAVVLVSMAPLFADVTGSVLGTVRDSSQAIIAGANIVATNTDTNLTKSAVSSPTGEYRLLAVPPGPYKLVVTVY